MYVITRNKNIYTHHIVLLRENFKEESLPPLHTTKLNSLLSHHRTCVSLIVVNFHLQD